MQAGYRWYKINCLKGAEAQPYQIEVWALGVIEAFEKAREQGYWPLSVSDSGWSQPVLG